MRTRYYSLLVVVLLFTLLVPLPVTAKSLSVTPSTIAFQADIYGNTTPETISYISDLVIHGYGGFGNNALLYHADLNAGDGIGYAISSDVPNAFMLEILTGSGSSTLGLTTGQYQLGTVSNPQTNELDFTWDIQQNGFHIVLQRVVVLKADPRLADQYAIEEIFSVNNPGPAFQLGAFSEYIHMDDRTASADYNLDGIPDTLLDLNYSSSINYPVFGKVYLDNPTLSMSISGNYASVRHAYPYPSIASGTTLVIGRSVYLSSTAKDAVQAGQQVATDASTLLHPSCPAGQWNGDYFNNDTLGVPLVLSRCDPKIDFYWGQTKPVIELTSENYSARWSQHINFAQPGWYRFRVYHDDGVRLWVNGSQLVNNWTSQAFREDSGGINIPAAGSYPVTLEYGHFSTNSSQIDLSWYRCPNGASDCNFDIIPDYQTRYLNQPMPKTCTTEENQTLATYGCKITSIAMALQKLGITTNPVELNDWLSGIDPKTHKAPRGYKDICSGELRDMDYIVQFAADPKYHTNISWQAPKTWPVPNDVASVIRNQKLPIIYQKTAATNKLHFILVTDVAEENGKATFGINDPWHSYQCPKTVADDPPLPPLSKLTCGTGQAKHAVTLSEIEQYNGTYKPLGTLQLNTKTHTPSLQFNSQNSEMLLTTNTGQRAGWDPVTGQIYQEINNSFYFDSGVDSPLGLINRSLFLPQVPSGPFKIQLYSNTELARAQSTSDPTYDLQIVGLDADFNEMSTQVSGSLADGNTFIITYDPGNGITVQPLRSIFIPMVRR